MYDILFIDDKFEEIKDTFFALQKDHIRCFYSDGENNLPQTDKEKLPFKNLRYICLDLHLENLSISTLKSNKNTVSILASVVKSFIYEGSPNIIINTSFIEEFDAVKSDFIKYLGFDPQIRTEQKNKDNNQKYSILHNQTIKEDIKQASHQSVLRNLVIREAIEIENLILCVIEKRFVEILQNNSEETMKILRKGFHFSHKIALFNMFNSNLHVELEKLRKLRNKFAHESEPPREDLLDCLKEIEDLKQTINS